MKDSDKIKIENLLYDLEDAFWITDKIKCRYQELKDIKEYQHIIQVIEVLEQEHNKLSKLIENNLHHDLR